MTPETIQGLYRSHAYAVFRRCRQLLRNDEEAHDAVHEVFLKILEEPARFEGRSSPASYLFAIATHVSLNRLRSRQVRGPTWQANVARAVEGGRIDPADGAEARQLASVILDGMDAETAAIAVYHYVDGLPQGEIARLVGCSRVTVNRRLRRFRRDALRRSEEP